MPRGCMHQYVLASPCGPAFFKPTAHRPASCCRENGVTLVAYSPLCQGLLTAKPCTCTVVAGRMESRWWPTRRSARAC